MDAYDKAIAWLLAQENPIKVINLNWQEGMYPLVRGRKKTEHPAYFLFGSLGKHRSNFALDRNLATKMECGCLTLIKYSLTTEIPEYLQTDKGLIEEIRNDVRVPAEASAIKLEDLELFAYYQRKADVIFNRPAPVWEGPELVTQGE